MQPTPYERAVDIITRRILWLVPRANAEQTTVTVQHRYEMLGQPRSDSWTGDAQGLARRVATALFGTDGPHAERDLHASLRDQLGQALIDAAAVPHTMPVQINGQACVLADAVLPITRRAAEDAGRAALEQAAALFEARGRALLDGGLTDCTEVATLLREYAALPADTAAAVAQLGALPVPASAAPSVGHECPLPDTRRLECGHCVHELCQDCDRCPCSCRCGKGGGS
ncbi:hypothetical protein IHE56_15290 [Streptomyces sp. ID01-12c]|uniref:hypothetical protein n=1 Tax=Streptomyces caniscabiei TaxID=2746961 RepID=UPI0017827E27|nr:hypothetical protein [Streptomyces caniscabiei]MBD9703422.1 hypothetical protein [Streptomyces caniscabiei]MDX3726913.1 hypothetical protein [Streptomyces caniscabiei]